MVIHEKVNTLNLRKSVIDEAIHLAITYGVKKRILA